MMNKLNIQRSLATLLVAAPIASFAAEKPNILLILIDDMGYECPGFNGGTTYSTPNLDKLVQKGMNFENCHAQPLSTPSRVQMMTGLYANRNYISFGELDRGQRTFANMAKDAGYKTVVSGKWQLGSSAGLTQHFGFDNYCLWQYRFNKRSGDRYANALYEIDGERVSRNIDTYGPDVYSKYLCDYIDNNASGNDPLFIYYPMALVHTPFTPTPDSEDWSNKELRESNISIKYYGDIVTYADKVIGNVVEALKRNNIYDNTLILIVGDNGSHPDCVTTMRDGSQITGGKKSTKRNGTHVPFFAVWNKKIKEGSINKNIVDFSDFYPTLRDAMGADAKLDRELDGISFYPQLLGKKSTPREISFCHYPWITKPFRYMRFSQTADYKLYSTGRFYNTRKDPNESRNITKISATAEENAIRKALQANLDSYPEGSEILTVPTQNITK